MLVAVVAAMVVVLESAVVVLRVTGTQSNSGSCRKKQQDQAHLFNLDVVIALLCLHRGWVTKLKAVVGCGRASASLASPIPSLVAQDTASNSLLQVALSCFASEAAAAAL